MSEKSMQYWIRLLQLKSILIVSSDGVFSDKELCEECGKHNCYEVTAELAQSVDPNDIKRRVVRKIEGEKITKLSSGKAAIDLG